MIKKWQIVKNPKAENCMGCVVIHIPDNHYNGFILTPFTKFGYPSTATKNLIYLLPDTKIYPWTKQGADKYLKFCSLCNDKSNNIHYNPLKKISVYHNKWKCKNCKAIHSKL